MFSSIALALIYQYYYHGGDTMVYFAYALKIKDITNENFMAFLDLAFNPYFSKFNAEYYLGSQTVHFFMNDSSRFIIRITLYLSILLLNSYLSISFIFCCFVFMDVGSYLNYFMNYIRIYIKNLPSLVCFYHLFVFGALV